MSDPTNPDHYTRGGVEVADVLQAKLTPEEFAGFCKGNILKYMLRAGYKGPALRDYEKAQWYLARLIAHLTQHPPHDS